jgi:hypothetical protein
MDLPISCSLSPLQLQGMRDGLLPGLVAKSTGKEHISEGFRCQRS